MSLQSPKRGYISHIPASKWEESLIIGNGKMGALVPGDPGSERIILSHERLFMPLHPPLPPVDSLSHLAEIREMISSGKYQEAADFVKELADKAGYGGKRWTDPFFPACDLVIASEAEGVTGYSRSLDFSTGLASVEWISDKGNLLERAFVSRADDVIVISLSGDVKWSLSFDQHPTDGEGYWQGPERKAKCLKGFETDVEPGWLSYRDSYTLTDGGYACVARVTSDDGTSEVEDGVLRVAGNALLLVKIYPLDKFADFDLAAAKEDLAAIQSEFDVLLDKHVQVHGEIFNRVTLDLHGDLDRNVPAESLVERSHNDDLSPALLEKVFDAGRYAILSSCGELPPNLQGVWAGTWGPPWSGDYTLNGNVQSAIASILNANMPECMKSFVDYIEWLIPDSRINAQALYGCRGVFLASRTSTHGMQNHFCSTWPMTFWTAGAAWAAQFFYDYYLYTGDTKFLAEHAVPYMKEAALFYEDFLIPGDDGKYAFNPSYSPENHPIGSESQACINATMDVGCARELFANLVEACNTLGIEQDSVARWKDMIAELPEYQINKDGAVKEWLHPDFEDNYAHRHCSHLYPLFNGLPSDIAADPKIVDGFKKAMEFRLEERRKEEGGGVMAFGLVQLGLAGSSLRSSDAVSLVIDRLAKNYYYRNLATSHDPGEIFNTDTSGGLPAVIIKALVQSQLGQIDFLPAVPKQMPSGTLSGVLCRGQIRVDRLSWDSTQINAVMVSEKDQDVTITLPFAAGLVVAGGERITGFHESFKVSLRAGVPFSISAVK